MKYLKVLIFYAVSVVFFFVNSKLKFFEFSYAFMAVILITLPIILYLKYRNKKQL